MAKPYYGKLMTLQLSFGDVPTTRVDKGVTVKTLTEHKASWDGGEWRTRLFAKNNIYVKRIRAVLTEARSYIKKVTLQTDTPGLRFVKTSYYLEVKNSLNILKHKYEDAVKSLLDSYDIIVEREQARLNALAPGVEFPSKEHIGKRFKFEFNFGGIPEGHEMLDKYGASLSAEEAEKLAKEVESRVRTEVREAMIESYRKVFEVVLKVAKRLGDEDTIIKESLFKNLREFLNLMPHLNLTDDPKLEEIRKQIEEKLSGFTAENIKTPARRKEAAVNALDIVKQMSSYFGDGGDVNVSDDEEEE